MTSTETSVPRLKVRTSDVTRTRIAYDYKMEHAFTTKSFDTFYVYYYFYSVASVIYAGKLVILLAT
jgi:hypothetical protein